MLRKKLRMSLYPPKKVARNIIHPNQTSRLARELKKVRVVLLEQLLPQRKIQVLQ